jgi:hypothetical protein
MLSVTCAANRAIMALLMISAAVGHSFGQLTSSPNPAQEAAIGDRDAAGNGIYLQSPKIYDDSSLQLMLNSLRAQLSGLQVISPTALQSATGAISGGSSVQDSFAAQVNAGPQLPGLSTTTNGPTSQTQTVTGSTPGTTVTTTLPNQSTVAARYVVSSPSDLRTKQRPY